MMICYVIFVTWSLFHHLSSHFMPFFSCHLRVVHSWPLLYPMTVSHPILLPSSQKKKKLYRNQRNAPPASSGTTTCTKSKWKEQRDSWTQIHHHHHDSHPHPENSSLLLPFLYSFLLFSFRLFILFFRSNREKKGKVMTSGWRWSLYISIHKKYIQGKYTSFYYYYKFFSNLTFDKQNVTGIQWNERWWKWLTRIVMKVMKD